MAVTGTSEARTGKLRVIPGAGAYTPLPAWVACKVQVPAVSRVAVLPDTVHTAGVSEPKLTGKPELALATSARAVPEVWGFCCEVEK